MTPFTPIVPPRMTVLNLLSPRVARVQTAEGTVAYCKRVEDAHRTIPEATELLRREAALLEAIARSTAHGCVPRVLEQGVDNAGAYLLLAEARGLTLAATPLGAVLPSARAAVRRTFEALAQIHRAATEGAPLELVHGDLSPENVLYTETEVIFMDWELGRGANVADLALGPFRGTLRYVAPEVAEGERPTQASDVFALGLSLLDLLAGVPIRKHSGAAGILEAAETRIDLATVFATTQAGAVRDLQPFFAAVLGHVPVERPADGSAALRLL